MDDKVETVRRLLTWYDTGLVVGGKLYIRNEVQKQIHENMCDILVHKKSKAVGMTFPNGSGKTTALCMFNGVATLCGIRVMVIGEMEFHNVFTSLYARLIWNRSRVGGISSHCIARYLK
jgi:ABC-type lipopolysaccharide export system ATPase subunit